MRMFHYTSPHVRHRIAIALKKELIGYRLLVHHEQQHRRRFDWVLLLREDAHFFAPLNLSAFAPGVVHGKGCGRYGGWNDHVYLIARSHAEAMLSSYRDLHTPQAHEANGSTCRLSGTWSGALTGSRRWRATRWGMASAMDLLACGSSEQWRERVGKLWNLPYTEHPPERLPTADARLVSRAAWGRNHKVHLDAAAFGAAEREDAQVVGCFPDQYALASAKVGERCVPEADVPMVKRRNCLHGGGGQEAGLEDGAECVVSATRVVGRCS